MASPGKVQPPSYEQTMERLGRSPEHQQKAAEPSSAINGQSNDSYLGVDDCGTGYKDAGVDESGTRHELSGEPATISHTMVQPKVLQSPAPVHLPLVIRTPSQEPPGHYTRRKKTKKSMSRSASKTSTKSGSGGGDAVKREESIDWFSSPSTPEGFDPNAPVVIAPMETRVGSDGRTYLGETSIEVVVHEKHEIPNTRIVYGRSAKPIDYRWYSIVGMVCFICFGFISFRKSMEAREKFQKRKFAEAQKASVAARNWATAALFTGTLIVVTFLFLLFVSPCPLARWLEADHICPLGT